MGIVLFGLTSRTNLRKEMCHSSLSALQYIYQVYNNHRSILTSELQNKRGQYFRAPRNKKTYLVPATRHGIPKNDTRSGGTPATTQGKAWEKAEAAFIAAARAPYYPDLSPHMPKFGDNTQTGLNPFSLGQKILQSPVSFRGTKPVEFCT